MNKRITQMGVPPEATVLENPIRLDGDDAPTDDLAPPPSGERQHAPFPPDLHDPQTAPAAPLEQAPFLSGEASAAAPAENHTALPANRPEPPMAAWHNLPVASVLPPVAPLLQAAPLSPLEERILRLEAELSQLRTPASGDPRNAAQHGAPVRTGAAFWSNLGTRLISSSGPKAAAPQRTEGLASMIPPGVHRTWMLLDALTELRAMYCMFFDPRYRLSWMGRLAPVVIFGLIFSSWLWMPFAGLTGFGWIVVKLGDVVLAYALFKLLSYEARRYRETAPDLPPSLRL